MSTLPTIVPTLGSFEQYLQAIHKFPRLSHTEEQQLFHDYQEYGDVQSAYKIATSNLRFVVHIAKEYNGYDVAIDELVQEGNIGLMKSISHFDSQNNPNVRFTSFAVHWIRAEILQYVMRQTKQVRFTSGKKNRKLFFNLSKYTSQRSKSFSDQTLQQISTDLDVPISNIKNMEQYLYSYDYELDKAVNEESSHGELIELVAPEMSNPLEQLLYEEQHNINITDAMVSLNEREQHIINSRWLCDNKRSLSDLGNELNVSAERVRQLETKAFNKLKKSLIF